MTTNKNMLNAGNVTHLCYKKKWKLLFIQPLHRKLGGGEQIFTQRRIMLSTEKLEIKHSAVGDGHHVRLVVGFKPAFSFVSCFSFVSD